jgi:hypothetical protein
MTYGNVLLVLHIAGVCAWLGANFVQLAIAPRMDREGTTIAAAWTRQTMWLGERYYSVAGAWLAITGILLVIHEDLAWRSGFIWVGVVVIVIGAVLGVAAFTPLAKRRLGALEAGDAAGAKEAQSRIIPLALLDTVLVLIAMLAMVDHWHIRF